MARKKSGGRKKSVSRQKNGRHNPPSKRNGSRAEFHTVMGEAKEWGHRYGFGSGGRFTKQETQINIGYYNAEASTPRVALNRVVKMLKDDEAEGLLKRAGSPARVVESLQRNTPEPWSIKLEDKLRVSYDVYGFSDRLVDVMKIHDESGNVFEVRFVDHSDYIEVYGVFAETMGTGFGTKILDAIKQYADENDKGMLITYVANEKFFQRFPWLQRRDAVIDEDLTFTEVGGWPEYVYGDVPEDAMDYSYILKVMRIEG